MNPSMADPHDRLTVVRCQLGDRDAWTDLIARWEPRVAYYIARMTSAERAEGLIQDCWVRVWSGIRSLDDPARFASWLHTIARRVVLDELREKYGRMESRAELPEVAADAAEVHGDPAEIHAALATLSPVHREAMVLAIVAGLSTRELSEVLEIPEGTVKSRLSAARAALRKAVEARGTKEYER